MVQTNLHKLIDRPSVWEVYQNTNAIGLGLLLETSMALLKKILKIIHTCFFSFKSSNILTIMQFSHYDDIFWYYNSNMVNRLNLQIQLNVIGWIENVAVSNKIAKTNI